MEHEISPIDPDVLMLIDPPGSAALAAMVQTPSRLGASGNAPGIAVAPVAQSVPASGFQPSAANLSLASIGILQDEARPSLEPAGRSTGDTRSAQQPASSQEPDEEGRDGLTPEEEAVVRELQKRDAEVRRHEQAHAAVGGPYAGAPRYEYQRGPDDRLYAIGGEVSIDTSPIPGDPQATIAKAQQVRRAALAPSEPSPQDRQVAAEAQRMIATARAELRSEQAEERAESRAVDQPAQAPEDDSASRRLQANAAFGDAANQLTANR